MHFFSRVMSWVADSCRSMLIASREPTPFNIGWNIAAVALLGACATLTTESQPLSQGPNLGRAASAEEIAAWDISVPPTGVGLPAGSGSVKEGESVYVAKCQGCHGAKGLGKPADPLVGGIGSLSSGKAVLTVGSYWPYATTLFDYVRRAMPTTNPQSLSDIEVYAVTAYVLYLNGIVEEGAVLDAVTLPQVAMPNRDGFVDWSRR
jgi:mono/diheme cytochrome c family protein